MLSLRHSIGNASPLASLARHSKNVPHFHCYASPPPTETCAHCPVGSLHHSCTHPSGSGALCSAQGAHGCRVGPAATGFAKGEGSTGDRGRDGGSFSVRSGLTEPLAHLFLIDTVGCSRTPLS